MEHLILFIYTGLLFIGLSSQQENKLIKFAPARVVDVKNGINNSYFAAVKDSCSPTGWAVEVKQNFNRYKIDTKFLVYMFDNSKTTGDKYGKVHTFFGTFLCDLLISDSRFDQFPQQNNLPRDVINLIFPGRQGSCNLTEGTKSIMPSANVNIAEYNNPKIKFPNSSYFELYVNILSQDLRDDLENNYFFQVKLIVGNPPGTGYNCFNRQWNYFIVWRICTIAEFIESIIFGAGKRILHLF
ncbi:uncharacterized protein LOC131667402 [Phymastichus coffea]|uniref:uncharacterized protein LOC131667402 n=1 Tax=Phymastichus coffea TaxID=108790 RepID=UPI00273B4150|nr:uncharacterized protein LOC131667402 [Phymastichus coffea]